MEDKEDRQIWLRAFYGFDPEGAGYIGFTNPADRETMFNSFRNGDLVLIYGAADDLTAKDQRSQALGFLEISLDRCSYADRMSQQALEWRLKHGFDNRWQHGIKVVRAWRVLNRVAIRSVAPIGCEQRFRFERTNRAKLLTDEEKIRALSHSVEQVNVYGERQVSTETLQRGQLSGILSPSRGVAPSFGQRTSNYEDGENCLYLMMLSSEAGALLGINHEHREKALIKIGRSKNPKDRLNQVNFGFPEKSTVKWTLRCSQKFPSAQIAHQFEDELKLHFANKFVSEGGEFYTGDTNEIQAEFNKFCYSKLPKISGAPGKARGI